MASTQAWLFNCDEADCDEQEFMEDGEGSLPMEWTEDEEADQHRCGGCSREKGALTFGLFRAATAAMAARARTDGPRI